MALKTIFVLNVLTALLLSSCSSSKHPNSANSPTYLVTRLTSPMSIDGNWDKPQWQNAKIIEPKYFMGDTPKYIPQTRAKVMYNDSNLFVIFKVQEQFVKCVMQNINDDVCSDPTVEFFFAPDAKEPLKYFNLEINCGGVPLMYYVTEARKVFKPLTNKEIESVEIFHSFPKSIEKEIPDTTTWVIEYRLPLSILKKYSKITQPQKGVVWKANFYKIAFRTTNPHFITWSFVDNPEPDFHLPQFFGTLIFQ